jgi:hypothetical protein
MSNRFAVWVGGVVLVLSLSLIPSISYAGKPVVSLQSGVLRLEIDETGRVLSLSEPAGNWNYLADKENSYLIQCRMYGDRKTLLPPQGLRVLDKNAGGAVVKLDYEGGVELTVGISTCRGGYLKMELLGAKPLKEIYEVVWGPYKTRMRGPVGDWIGLVRDRDFTIGLMSLEPNTDGGGDGSKSAGYASYGSWMLLCSYDHTRPMRFAKFRTSRPISVTVKGSKVALFGIIRGKGSELNIIGTIEANEGLPHSIFLRKWEKRTRAAQRLSLFAKFDARDAYKYLKLAEEFTAGMICRSKGYYGSWGHFGVDKKLFPAGLPFLRKFSDTAWRKSLVLNSAYVFSGYLKSISTAEPFLCPKPDERLATWDLETELLSDISARSWELEVKDVYGLLSVFKSRNGKVLRVGDELVVFKEMEKRDGSILLTGVTRGAFMSAAAPHGKGTRIKCLYGSGDHLYPGTVDMSNEVASHIAASVVNSGSHVLILDGYESCRQTGHGAYATNIFAKTIYNTRGNVDRLMSCNLPSGNYKWHMMSYHSVGGPVPRWGFRGGMIDARIARQIQLRDNLMPNKMGRFYPGPKTTLADLEWLYARVCGWDSGVDLEFGLDIYKNPSFKAIRDVVRLWEEARSRNAFSDSQKMQLRQTDRMYSITKDSSNVFHLDFKGLWRYAKLKIAPPSAFKIKVVAKGSELKPCSIKWLQTHNPGVFSEAGVSDDLVASAGASGAWDVTPPPVPSSGISSNEAMLPILRVPADSPGGIKNIRIVVNGKALTLPVSLFPGEYLSFPHEANWGCVYDAKTNAVKREFRAVRTSGRVFPYMKRGKSNNIELDFDSILPKSKSRAILNLRFRNPILGK